MYKISGVIQEESNRRLPNHVQLAYDQMVVDVD